MIYLRRLTEEEQAELRRMTRQEVGRVSQRAQRVLLAAQRRTVPELAQWFDYSRATVRSWLKQFEQDGPPGLYDAPRSGRPRKVSAAVEQKMVDLVQDDPQPAGFLSTIWTVAMLTLALTTTLAVALSRSAVRAALHRLDLHWGRPRLTMPTKVDPAKAPKQWAIAKAVVEAGPAAAVLYEDESRINLLPLVRALWHWAGQQVRVPTPGTNVARALFGALEIHTGRWVYQVRERMRTEDFLAFLDYLLEAYPTGLVLLIVDNYSSHTAHAVTAWVQEHPRLRLYYLPTYCSHLNPVERIWLRLKNEVAADRLYGSLALLLETVASFFAKVTPQQALTWAAE
jgi:transposase